MWLSGVVTSNPQWFNEYTTNLFHNVLFYFQIFAWEETNHFGQTYVQEAYG